MRINTITKTMILSTLIAGASACQRKPLVEMPEEFISRETKQTLDSIKEQSQNILNDTTYGVYGYDTLRIAQPISLNQLKENIDYIAKKNDKQVIVGKFTVMTPVRVGKTTTYHPRVHYKYASEHINQKAVIKSDKMFTTDSTDLYVPVEYYGQKNPEVTRNKKDLVD